MRIFAILAVLLLACVAAPDLLAADGERREILITLKNETARTHGRVQAPYQFRKRYHVSPDTRRRAAAIAREFSLERLDDWPIDSLSVYCIVYSVPAERDVQKLIETLRADSRITSAQLMNEFSSSASGSGYDDTYADMQHALPALGIPSAHAYTQGFGARVAVIDSAADILHEDLEGQVRRVQEFIGPDLDGDNVHGTAIVSIIGALSNNSLGIVGVAPASEIDLYIACWNDAGHGRSICNTFTLAKALDAVIKDGTDVLNMSLRGPYDPLIDSLLTIAADEGIIIVAAAAPDASENAGFPASQDYVIAVSTSQPRVQTEMGDQGSFAERLFAPGQQVMVAAPGNGYELQSGSSIAAAHVSGTIALLRASIPEISAVDVHEALLRSQSESGPELKSVDACVALSLLANSIACHARAGEYVASK